MDNINFKKVLGDGELFDQQANYEDNFEKINQEVVPKITDLETNKVDKVAGKGLSTNDFDNTYKQKIDTDIPAQLAEKANQFYVDLITEFASTGKNKIDTTKISLDKLLNEVTGETISLSNYITSAYIPVKAGDVVTAYPIRVYVLYDLDLNPEVGENTGSNSAKRTITVIKNGFLRVSTSSANFGVLQVEDGMENTDYELYKVIFPGLSLLDSQRIKFKDGKIRVQKLGDSYNLFGEFGKDKEIKIETSAHGSSNGTFRLYNTLIDGVVVHAAQDDITPIRTWTTVGANHGYTSIVRIALSGHDKKNADLGSTWTDGITEYVLLKIDGSYLYFGCPYTVTDGVVSSVTIPTMPTSDLTHVIGATNTSDISIAIKSASQLFPSVNNVEIEYVLDGNKIVDDGEYNGNDLKIYESYMIMDYKEIIDYAKSNIGSSYANDNIKACVKISNVFHYSKGLKCTVSTVIKAITKTTFANCGAIQSDPILNVGKPIKRYLDSVISKSGYDFKVGIDLNAYNTSLTFSKYTDLVSGDFPPLCSTDWAYDDNQTKLFGFGFGYIPDKTNSKNPNRIANLSDLWNMRNTKKSYPNLFGYQTLNPGEIRNSLSFRNYISPQETGEATTIHVIKDDKDTYVYLMAHKEITGFEVKLPDDIGKTITMIQAVNVSLVNDIVDASGVTVNITGEYGFAVIKVN